MRLLPKRKDTLNQGDLLARRKRTRFQAMDGAFAFLDLKAMVAGQILNINEDGLCFRYVASEQQSKKARYVNIVVRDWNFRSKQLTCEAVWDQPEPHELSFGPFSVRYCGIRFGKLTPAQKSDLTHFISRYAKSERPHNSNSVQIQTSQKKNRHPRI